MEDLPQLKDHLTHFVLVKNSQVKRQQKYTTRRAFLNPETHSRLSVHLVKFEQSIKVSDGKRSTISWKFYISETQFILFEAPWIKWRSRYSRPKSCFCFGLFQISKRPEVWLRFLVASFQMFQLVLSIIWAGASNPTGIKSTQASNPPSIESTQHQIPLPSNPLGI